MTTRNTKLERIAWWVTLTTLLAAIVMMLGAWN